MAAEALAKWAPLECKLSPKLRAEFMWMYRVSGVEHYKHIVTRRYLRLDQDGRCLTWAEDGLKEVSFAQEWKRVTGRAGGNGRNAVGNRRAGWREAKRRKVRRGWEAL